MVCTPLFHRWHSQTSSLGLQHQCPPQSCPQTHSQRSLGTAVQGPEGHCRSYNQNLWRNHHIQYF
uniref:Uncharacterized protein n=1 Tax=Anguilla anguilla TaxID=7936 RepID=A0A0E9TF35_ANGAN